MHICLVAMTVAVITPFSKGNKFIPLINMHGARPALHLSDTDRGLCRDGPDKLPARLQAGAITGAPPPVPEAAPSTLPSGYWFDVYLPPSDHLHEGRSLDYLGHWPRVSIQHAK